MVTDDLNYHKFRDWIIRVHERAQEKEPLNEDAGGDDEVDIDDPVKKENPIIILPFNTLPHPYENYHKCCL